MALIEEPERIDAAGDVARAPDSIHDVASRIVLIELFGVVEDEAPAAYHEFFQEFKEDLHGIAGVFLAAVDFAQDIEHNKDRVDFLNRVV